MILQVNQIKSSGKNIFEVIENEQQLYTVESPWVPVVTDKTRKITMTNPAGETVFSTQYNWIENWEESMPPLKYLWTGSQKFDQYKVTDADGNVIGAFYKEVNEIAKRKLLLQCGNQGIIGYKNSIGDREVVSFYENDRQVGQLTRSNRVRDNLDRYLLHFVPGYEKWLPIIAFFTVYYDFMYHNNAGKVMVGYSVSVKYTYSKNCKMYNPHFIRDNFGEEEAERVRQIGKTWTGIDGENRKASLRMFWIIFGSCWAVGILVTLIILSNLFWF